MPRLATSLRNAQCEAAQPREKACPLADDLLADTQAPEEQTLDESWADYDAAK